MREKVNEQNGRGMSDVIVKLNSLRKPQGEKKGLTIHSCVKVNDRCLQHQIQIKFLKTRTKQNLRQGHFHFVSAMLTGRNITEL